MKLLVIGSGGREHALAWKLAQSSAVERVFVAPGNGGTALDPRLTNVALTEHDALAEFAEREHIALTVVGPEAPLAAGIVDRFRQRGLRIFGPTRAAAQLESSKDFAKSFMQRHRIPTAAYRSFTDAGLARDYVRERGAPIVIKADGLAAGKGVVVAQTIDEAVAAIDSMMVDNRLGIEWTGGEPRIVVEDFLDGEEASFIVISDGVNVLPLASSQDHKRLLDGDRGPNTGGMGAYSPAPIVSAQLHQRVMREIIEPTVRGMAADGIEYSGFLYAGLMIDNDGNPRTLEFNCRLGDPETQPIMMRLQSDLIALLHAAHDGRLNEKAVQWDPRSALGIVIAADGYPESPRKGDAIAALPSDTADCCVFHSGTTLGASGVVTAGGRVLTVTALGESLADAQQRAYRAAGEVRFAGMQYRRDIGVRGLRK